MKIPSLGVSHEGISDFFIVSVFLIYLQILPVQMETAPFLALGVVAFSIICYLALGRPRRFLADELVDLGLILILTVYFLVGMLSDRAVMMEYVKYIMGPVFYLFARRYIRYLSLNCIELIVWVLAGVAALTLLRVGPFISFLGRFIPRSVAGLGTRGLSILTPEPSYFGFFAIFLLVLIDYYLWYHGEPAKGKAARKGLYLKAMVVVLTLATASATSLLILLVYFVANNLPSKKNWYYWIGLPLVLIGVMYGITALAPTTRMAAVINAGMRLLANPSDVTYIFFYVEPSGGTRIILNLLAFSSVFFHPFGNGLGSFGNSFVDTAAKLGIAVQKHQVIRKMIGKNVYAQTYLANLVNDIGILSVFLVVLAFVGNDKGLKRSLKASIFGALAIMFFVQCQITNPIPWIMIAMLKKEGDGRLIGEAGNGEPKIVADGEKP